MGRKISAGLMTSDSPEWYTPSELIDTIVDFLGEIGLDPCADAGHRVPARQHFTQQDLGDMRSWADQRVYMNPPYGDAIKDWVAKACTEPVQEIVMLLPARLDTQWFQGWLTGYPMCLIEGRLQFVTPGRESTSAPFPSIIVYRGPRSVLEFAEAFAAWGPVYPPAVAVPRDAQRERLRLARRAARLAARRRDADPEAALTGLFQVPPHADR